MLKEIGELLTARHQGVAAADLPVDGSLPSFDGASGWLKSQPLTPSGLRGQPCAIDLDRVPESGSM